jgi:hypothetical protein
MWLLYRYRFFFSVAVGGGVFFFVRSIWLWILTSIVVRAVWFIVDRLFEERTIRRDFQHHIAEFKQQFGPYGIRLANKSEADPRVRKSLAEVFTSDLVKLKKTVELLEVMDVMFNAGMRPDGDEYLLHDLKLKYGKSRLANELRPAQ